MASNSVDRHRLTLLVLRLMDADLLLPEEERALLAEIEAFEQSRDGAAAEGSHESGEGLLRMLEALLQTDCLDGSIAGKAQAIVRRILHGTSDPS